MSLSKPTVRSIGTALGLLALGIFVCPRVPARAQVDPVELLRKVQQVSTPSSIVLPPADSVTPRVEGREQMSGRNIWILRLEPTHKPAPWIQLWVDEETGRVLAFRQWSAENRMLHTEKIAASRP